MAFFDGFGSLFGFRLKSKDKNKETYLTAVPPAGLDAGTVFSSSRFYSSAYAIDFNFSSHEELIQKYREMSIAPEIESAIDEIVNEMFYVGDNTYPVQIILDKLPYNDEIKKTINNEFNYTLSLLDFNQSAYDLFRRWYIDGRLFFNVVIDSSSPNEGIKELRYIDSKRLQKIYEPKKERKVGSLIVPIEFDEFYILDKQIKLTSDMVVGVTSGLTMEDRNGNITTISYLHKAIRPFNQLKMMEDATVIYRVARAPERRIFKIAFGNMPKVKIQQEMNELMNKFRNKIVYDPQTGEIKDDTRTLSMLEDFWIPVYDDGKATDISTLPGGQNLGEMEDVKYFLNKLYKALYVPTNRISIETQTSVPVRVTEIQREEYKFGKFIQRLRLRFSNLFLNILRLQLILKNIITEEDWEDIRSNIFFDYKMDSHFTEYNAAEIITRRIELSQAAISLGEGFFSKKYIQKKFLRLSDEEIEEIKMDLEVENKKQEIGGPSTEPDFEFGQGIGEFEPNFKPSSSIMNVSPPKTLGGDETNIETPIEKTKQEPQKMEKTEVSQKPLE